MTYTNFNFAAANEPVSFLMQSAQGQVASELLPLVAVGTSCFEYFTI